MHVAEVWISKALPVSQITGSGAVLVPAAERRNTPDEERALLERFAELLDAEAAACIEDQAIL